MKNSKTMKHTQWTKSKNRLQTDWILIRDGEFDGDDIIARINKTDYLDDESAEEAAKLIAAAPDLLEALQEFVMCIDTDLGQRKAYDMAKTAIKKATE